jgi:ribonuclease G
VEAPSEVEPREALAPPVEEVEAESRPADEETVPVPAGPQPDEETAGPAEVEIEEPAETSEPEPEPEVVTAAAEEAPATEAPVAKPPVEVAGEEAAAESAEEAEPTPQPETEETAEEVPQAEPAEAAATLAAPEPNGAPLPEGYPDAMTLAEIQRVRQYEDQVALPPSLKERTAGGVEWDKRRQTPQRRDRNGRRGRGRTRGRGRRDGTARAGDRRPRRDARPRGGRRPRPERRITPARPSRGQPAIAELLKSGQEIIVQIAKEQMGKKGARITSHVTLPGRFLVYMPTIDHIGISRRIGTSDERSRLRRLLLELKGTITGGFVVRTAAAGCSEEDLRRDIDYLIKLWHDMRARADEGPAPNLLHRDLNLVQRLLRDQLTSDYDAVWVDTQEEYTKIVDLVAQFQPKLTRRIKLFTKPEPIFEEMGVQQEIDRALRPKVWLKSGGYIVINQTEALVAIDVNTGKYVGKGSTRLEDTIVKTNVEAIEEIVRQIRLRDLGGIIVIDFIDMEDSRNRNKVMRALSRGRFAQRPLSLQAAVVQRIRPGGHHPQAQPPVAGTAPLPALSHLHRHRPHQVHPDAEL